MSSANRVQLNYIKEVDYGVTPAGDLRQIRFTDESLTGTPLTEQAKEIRSDRQTSGQVNTGLELAGGYNFLLSGDQSIIDFIGMAMMSDVITPTAGLVTNLTISGGAAILRNDAGDFIADGYLKGQLAVMRAWTVNAEYNTVILINSVVSGVLGFAGGIPFDVDETDVNATIEIIQNFKIGVDDVSVAISKEFLDLASRSLTYNGERVGTMEMNFEFGKIITGSFTLVGNGYDKPVLPMSNGRTVIPIGSDQPLDASNSFGMLLLDGADQGICIESFGFKLDNKPTAQNCVGKLAPTDQIVGSAIVDFSATIHLSGAAWDLLMQAKIDQTPISVSFFARDELGKGYAVALDKVQLNFPDPQAAGQDEQVKLDITGLASQDETTGDTITIAIID